MGLIIRISKENKIEDARKALNDLSKKSRKKSKTLADFYGKMRVLLATDLLTKKK